MAFRLAGEGLLDTGAAALLIVVRRWDTHTHVGAVTPAGDGAWSLAVADAGPYDVTTRGPSGYQPVVHGPVVAVEVP